MTDRPLDTGQAYRVQAWTTRVLAVVAVVLGMVCLALTGMIISLFPLKEVQPMLLIGGSKDDQIWRVEPFEVGTKGWDLIAEKQAQTYVRLRESIDLQTDTERWQEVAWLSSDEVFSDFRRLMGPSNPQSPYVRAKEEGLTRTVTPQVTNMLNPHQFQVEFLRRDFRGGVEISRSVLVATMTVEFQAATVRREDRFMNPSGWTVIAYGLAEKSQ